MNELVFHDDFEQATVEDVVRWEKDALRGDAVAFDTLVMMSFWSIHERERREGLEEEVARLRKRVPKRPNRNGLVIRYLLEIARDQLRDEGKINRRKLASETSIRMTLDGHGISVRAVRAVLRDSDAKGFIEFFLNRYTERHRAGAEAA